MALTCMPNGTHVSAIKNQLLRYDSQLYLSEFISNLREGLELENAEMVRIQF